MRLFSRDRVEVPAAPPDEPVRATPEPDTAPGWDAITAAGQRAYPGQTPHRWATILSRALGGTDPLDLVTVYHGTDPGPSWHYITYGLSDLYGAPDPASPLSGSGIELTFRLADPGADDPAAVPPVWPVRMLANLARYVQETGHVFAPGHFVNTDGPLAPDVVTALVALGFVEDPDLGTIDTPRGQVRFLQAVALTAEEVDLGSAWAMGAFLDLLVEHLPRGLTDLSRGSVTADPAVRAQVEAGTARDGSSIGVLYGEQVHLDAAADQTVLTLNTAAVPCLARTLPGRIRYGRPLCLVGNDDAAVTLAPGPAFAVDTSTLVLDDDAAAALTDALVEDLGDHFVPGLPLMVRVVPTQRRSR